ncbi:hypothetical protein EPD60_06970 [Flaviaesturariibacter flavus]|uniref:Uncharacterized protein n=1 Tax=Flaviaesturariibacter flavus TaxID=2502780 RepID=A0A4R1BID8_9BACT|nr:hypothetical protein [Flaviaesturariibacter flavus]TCJ17046.1 hypothetical protein EPD60_06970 [Flaviaesturariibacter flavus]
MHRKSKPVFVAANVVLALALLNAVLLEEGITGHPGAYRLLYLSVPAFMLALLYRRRRASRG